MLKVGKLDSDLLEQIVFKKITFKRPEVLTRPGIGEDCAVIDFGTYECVMSTDPITAAVGDIGRLAIHISCNDIASNGVEPLGIMLTVMMPEGTTTEDIAEIMKQAAATSEELGVEIIGGHTEITNAVNKPIIVSTAIGRGEKWASKHREAMKPGDYILLTKTAGLEGTAIIASDYEEDLCELLTAEEINFAKSLMNKVSVGEGRHHRRQNRNQRHARHHRRRRAGGCLGNVPSRGRGRRDLGGNHSGGGSHQKNMRPV